MTIGQGGPEGRADLRLVYEEDHKGAAIETLFGQFRSSQRVVSLVKAMAQAVQLTEDQVWNNLVSRVLDLGEAGILDQYGAIVGEPRDGLLDSEYSRFIQARALAITSHGTVDELIIIWRLLTYPSTVRYVPIHRTTGLTSDGAGGFMLYAHRTVPMKTQIYRKVGRIMKDVKPGTFEMHCVESYPGHFGFVADPDAEPYDVGVWAREVYPME